MTLAFETLFLTFGMFAVCLVPVFFPLAERNSKLVFLLATGAMLGICIFDLIPDVYEMGGISGLSITALVLVIYSAIHLFHMSSHTHEVEAGLADEHCGPHHHAPTEQSSFVPFFLSMTGHCFASGMLLAVAQNFSSKIALTVFAALVAHKGFESLTFTSILLTRKKHFTANVAMITGYCLSLPAGVLITQLIGDGRVQILAMLVSSVAVGSLLGCLVHDFIIPSAHHLKHRRNRRQIAWLVAGFVLTQVIMWKM